MYVLPPTKDVVPSELARRIFDELIMPVADVRKVNIACCKASSKALDLDLAADFYDGLPG